MKYILPLILVAGCATASAQVSIRIHKPGSNTYATSFTQSEVDNIVYFTLKSLTKDFEKPWDITFTNNFIVRLERSSYTSVSVAVFEGLTDPVNNSIIVYIYQPCLAASALIHEIGHAVGGIGHEDKLFWENVNNIQKEAIEEFCGKDYKVVPKPKPSRELNALIKLWIDEILNRQSL